MFVIRPRKIRNTPFTLGQDLHCQTRRWPNRSFVRIDYRTDFLMVPVPPQQVANHTSEYEAAYNFMTRNKYGQRQLLEQAGISVPKAATQHGAAWEYAFDPGLRFVVRPLRHSRGRNYRVTNNPIDFRPGLEYISELYPKKREYRVIFVFGKPLIYLRKKPHEGTSQEEPWGHTNSVFQTINDPANCRLSNTDCITKLSAFPAVKGAHIIAADILYNKKHAQPYVVLELNNCPALEIENNRAKIVEAIRGRVY